MSEVKDYGDWKIARLVRFWYGWKGRQGEAGCFRAMSERALLKKIDRADPRPAEDSCPRSS